MGKPTICIGENKGADQLRGNRKADQCLCFRYTDSILTLLLKSEILSFKPVSLTAQTGLCQTCSKTTLLVFPRGGLYFCKYFSGNPWLAYIVLSLTAVPVCISLPGVSQKWLDILGDETYIFGLL